MKKEELMNCTETELRDIVKNYENYNLEEVSLSLIILRDKYRATETYSLLKNIIKHFDLSETSELFKRKIGSENEVVEDQNHKFNFAQLYSELYNSVLIILIGVVGYAVILLISYVTLTSNSSSYSESFTSSISSISDKINDLKNTFQIIKYGSIFCYFLIVYGLLSVVMTLGKLKNSNKL